MEPPPSAWESSPCKQKLDMARVWDSEWKKRVISRAPSGPALEVWPVLLQLLVVSGNSEELGRERRIEGVSLASLTCCVGGTDLGPGRRWGGHFRSTVTLYWSLGLTRFQGSGFFLSQL